MIGKKTVLMVLLLVGVCVAYFRRESTTPTFPTSMPTSVPPAETNDKYRNYELSLDFIRWIELSYIYATQRVDGFDTDIADSVKELGLEKTIDRYSELRRIDLDYAMEHPDDEEVPQAVLDEIAGKKVGHVLANVRSSNKWIDYENPKLRKSMTKSFSDVTVFWIPFYRRLLSTPIPSGKADFMDLMRAAFSQQEYESVVEKSTRGTINFYVALKMGVAWYRPLVRRVVSSTQKKEVAMWKATAEQIYAGKQAPLDDTARISESATRPAVADVDRSTGPPPSR